MSDDPFNKLRRVDRCLATLNFLLAGTNMLSFPCCAFGWWFAWSMNDMPSQHPEALPLFICMGGVVLLGSTLCLGFAAGLSLLRGQPLGTTLTKIVIVLAGVHLIFAAGVETILRWDSSREVNGLLGGSVFFNPSFLYCIVASILLKIRNSIRLFDPIVDAEKAQFRSESLGDSQGIVQGNQFLGTTFERPAMKAQLPTEHPQDD